MATDLGRIHTQLTHLYGPLVAGDLADRVAQRIAAHRPGLARPPTSGPWTAGDAFLIAYPDQLSGAGPPPLETLLGFCRRHLEGVVSGVHLLPFYPWSSDEGFSVMEYRAVDPAFGDWTAIEALGQRFRLMVDLVLNHASARGAWFEAFLRDEEPYRRYFYVPDPLADWSQVVRPRTSPLFTSFATAAGDRPVWTTFSADQVDLDYRQPELLLEMLDVLLGYARRGAQLIRLDAVTYVWKEPGTTCVHRPQGHALVRLLRAVLDGAAPWVRLITETNVPHLENISYFGDGDEADLVYQFALPPLVLHTLLSGSAARLTEWTAELAPPPGRGTFFNFLASHDGIGLYPVRDILPEADLAALETVARSRGAISYRTGPAGARQPYELNLNLLDALTDPSRPGEAIPRLLAAHAILFALPGVPAIYFHSLFGSRGDRQGLTRTGQPRQINRQRLVAAELESQLAEPTSERHRIFAALRRLLRVRSGSDAFHPRAAHRSLDLGPGVFAVRRLPPSGSPAVVCLHEVGGETRRVAPAAGLRAGVDLLSGERMPGGPIELTPYQVRWIEEGPGEGQR